MGFCMGCGKQIENGDYCEECSANVQTADNTAAVAAVQAAPRKKMNVNGKIAALLSLLGVFGIMTIVVGVLFG